MAAVKASDIDGRTDEVICRGRVAPNEFLPFQRLLIQGVQEKLCFFTIHCNPSLAYIAVRDLQSSQRNASVQSLLLAGNFLYNQ